MSVRLRRGFKTEANAIAQEIRDELDLTPLSPLDPRLLAEHLAIPVWGLGALKEFCPDAVRHFAAAGLADFSAVTVFCGRTRVIVHNDNHSPGRQYSNLAHELAHALLLHQASPALDRLGCRDWDPELELEADWLGGALLLPDEITFAIAHRGWPDEWAADHFGVSLPMLRFRINVTGARRRAAMARSSGTKLHR